MKGFRWVLLTALLLAPSSYAQRRMLFTFTPMPTDNWGGSRAGGAGVTGGMWQECNFANLSPVDNQEVRIIAYRFPVWPGVTVNSAVTDGTAGVALPEVRFTLVPGGAHSIAWGGGQWSGVGPPGYGGWNPYKLEILVTQDKGAIQGNCVLDWNNQLMSTQPINGGRPF